MAHDKVFGICENKCLVPVAPKTDVDAVEERVTDVEDSLSNINFENDGTLLANTIKTSKIYVICELSSEQGDFLFATNKQSSASANVTSTYQTVTSSTITPNMSYQINEELTFPLKLSPGIYIEDSSDLIVPKITSLTAVLSSSMSHAESSAVLYKNGQVVASIGGYSSSGGSKSVEVQAGDKLYCTYYGGAKNFGGASVSIQAKPDLYIW